MSLRRKPDDKMSRYRERLRASGLRPVQIWVPDSRREGFAEECRRQSALLRNDPQENNILDWIEAAADHRDWQ